MGDRRRLAALGVVEEQRDAVKRAGDGFDFGGRLRRLDEEYVGSGLAVAECPLERGGQPFDGARVGAGDD